MIWQEFNQEHGEPILLVSIVCCRYWYYKYSNIGYGLVNSTCVGCASGFFSTQGSSIACTACPVGQYSGTLATACSPCAINMYAGSIGSSSCTPCPTGQTASVGSPACSSCLAGNYLSGNSCITCMSTGIATCGPLTNTANTWWAYKLFKSFWHQITIYWLFILTFLLFSILTL